MSAFIREDPEVIYLLIRVLPLPICLAAEFVVFVENDCCTHWASLERPYHIPLGLSPGLVLGYKFSIYRPLQGIL